MGGKSWSMYDLWSLDFFTWRRPPPTSIVVRRMSKLVSSYWPNRRSTNQLGGRSIGLTNQNHPSQPPLILKTKVAWVAWRSESSRHLTTTHRQGFCVIVLRWPKFVEVTIIFLYNCAFLLLMLFVFFLFSAMSKVQLQAGMQPVNFVVMVTRTRKLVCLLVVN